MITIYILTSEFRNSPCCDRNNPEWLRKRDKKNGSFNIAAPYPKNDYFRRSFIEPLLDDGGYIKEEFGVFRLLPLTEYPIVLRNGTRISIKKVSLKHIKI